MKQVRVEGDARDAEGCANGARGNVSADTLSREGAWQGLPLVRILGALTGEQVAVVTRDGVPSAIRPRQGHTVVRAAERESIQQASIGEGYIPRQARQNSLLSATKGLGKRAATC